MTDFTWIFLKFVYFGFIFLLNKTIVTQGLELWCAPVPVNEPWLVKVRCKQFSSRGIHNLQEYQKDNPKTISLYYQIIFQLKQMVLQNSKEEDRPTGFPE
jgi:hypothetical protein